VLGGVGPRFVNHGKPTLAVWQAGAGAFIGLGGPVFLDLGVGFQQAFPRDRCDRTYTFETTETPSSVVTLGGACLVTISPRIGLAIGLGVGGESRKRSRRKRSGDAPPAVRGSTAPAPPPPASTPPLAPTPLDPHEAGSETEPPDRAPDPTRPEPAAPAVDETGSVSPTAPPDTDATTTPPPIDPEATGGASAPPPSEPASPSLEAEMPAPDATVDPEVGAPAPRSARSAPRRHLADAAAQSTAAGP
jgi:hypothetical protein